MFVDYTGLPGRPAAVRGPMGYFLSKIKIHSFIHSFKEKHFGHLVTFWFGTFAMLFSTTGCVVGYENTRR